MQLLRASLWLVWTSQAGQIAVKGCSTLSHSTRRLPWEPLILIATSSPSRCYLEMPILTRHCFFSQPSTRQGPEGFAVASFFVTKPADKLAWFCPLPTHLDPLGKQLVIFSTDLGSDPVSAVAFNASVRPPSQLKRGEGSRPRECIVHHFLTSLTRLRVRVATTD